MLRTGFISTLLALYVSAAPGQERSLKDLLQVGQQVTVGAQEGGGVMLRLYSPVQQQVALELASLERHAYQTERSASSLRSARMREGFDAERLRGADPEERMRMMAEMRGAGGFSSARRSPPPAPMFFEIAELGRDYVSLRGADLRRNIALHSIREVQQQWAGDEGAEDEPTRDERARRELAQRQLGVTLSMLNVYRLDVGDFPSTDQGLAALLRAPMDLPAPENWRGPYYPSRPAIQDPWGQPLRYQRQAQAVTVASDGADGETGTQDDLESSMGIPEPAAEPTPVDAPPSFRPGFLPEDRSGRGDRGRGP